MVVLVQHTAEMVTPVDGQIGEPVRIDDRFWQWREWTCVRDPLVWPMLVIEDLELAQRVQQVALVPDQGAVQLPAAGPHPPLHNGVHPGRPDAAAYHRDSRLGQDRVEQRWVFAVPVPDEVSGLRPGACRSMTRFGAACVTHAALG